MAAIIELLVGAIQLLLGRKVFWLMVGIMGFLIGFFLTVDVLRLPDWMKLLIGLGAGIVFAILAVFLQKPMAAVFAFFAFGLAVSVVASRLGHIAVRSPLFWVIFAIAGVIGIILVYNLFDWALIIGTSLSGSVTVVSAIETMLPLPKNGWVSILLFLVLLLIGIMYQSRNLKPVQKRVSASK